MRFNRHEKESLGAGSRPDINCNRKSFLFVFVQGVKSIERAPKGIICNYHLVQVQLTDAEGELGMFQEHKSTFWQTEDARSHSPS